MDDVNAEHRDGGDLGATEYEAPAVESRASACDPLVMIVNSPVVCL
jgi:hypothetical protein